VRAAVVRADEASSRRERIGWYTYDWANSAFSTTVVTVFLGPYLTAIARAAADADGFVRPFGLPIAAASFFPYAVSLSVLLQIVALPVLGAIADYSHMKKQLLGLFALVGAASTMGLFLVDGTNYGLGGVLFLVANLSFGASIVFYNAFLPEIAGPDERDGVSSRGWAAGYLGGGLLLALNLALFSQAEAIGLTPGLAVRIGLLSAGVWWAAFTLVPLLTLRTRQPQRPLPRGESYLTAGFRQLAHTIRGARAYPHTLLFLLAYIFFNDGVQTVIALSSQFGQEELGLPISTLTSVILMVQFVAIFGAFGFLKLSTIIGPKRAVAISLIIWTGTVTYAFAFLRTTLDFFILAGVIALVLGGTQALSRSLFSQMIPRGQEAEYFSLYEVSDKGTSWLGPLLFGLALQFTGSYRVAILSLVILFAVGLALLSRVNIRQAALAAGNTPPTRT
jgi:MFS transporter, UMF1 family